ncbi:acyltransferase [Thioclava kandeliae]|uniref:Acyltransferase n=1 Tax=Thioclava kandeliae TaxID=3070818 RepID=A0ABV1SMA3_9RHOB
MPSSEANREVWLDVIRGVTITLVVLHHSMIATKYWSQSHDIELHRFLGEFGAAMGMARMPAFFLCSGILFAEPARRGIKWFLKNRFLWAFWVVLLWTTITYLASQIGIHHYPWISNESASYQILFLINPYGNFWFIYAIAILGAMTVIFRRLPIGIKSILVLVSSALMLASLDVFNYSSGMKTLIWNLGARGILFFSMGVFLASHLRKPFKTKYTVAALMLSIWFVAYVIKRQGIFSYDLATFLLQLPATIAFVYLVQFVAQRAEWFSQCFSRLGKYSLDIFLLHQFFIGLIYATLVTVGFTISSTVTLAIIFSGSVIFALISGIILRQSPKNFFFKTPPLPKRIVSLICPDLKGIRK